MNFFFGMIIAHNLTIYISFQLKAVAGENDFGKRTPKSFRKLKLLQGDFMKENTKISVWPNRFVWLMVLLVLLGLMIVPAFAAEVTIPAVVSYVNSESVSGKMVHNFRAENSSTTYRFSDGDTVKLTNAGHIKIADGQTLSLDGCTFDLSTRWRGIRLDGGTLNLNNCNFSGGTNGAINNIGGTVNIVGGTFSGNTADIGGAIRVENGTLSITGGAEFTENTSTFPFKQWERSGGGAIYAKNSNVTIYDAVFRGNNAYSNGGAIAHDGGTLILGDPAAEYDYVKAPENVRPRFEGNSAGEIGGQPKTHGGALAVDIDCDYDPNSGYQPDMRAACQSSVKDMTVTVNHAVFDNNTAGHQGGALSAGYDMKGYWTSNHTTTKETNVLVDLKQAAFTNNKVTRNNGDNVAGGAIVIQTNVKVKMSDAAFLQNHASNAGGAIASCLWGANQISLVEGAAIFDNTAADWTNEYSDVYVMNITDPEFHPSNFSPRMFTGALHNWTFQNNIEKPNSCDSGDPACQKVCPEGICHGVFQRSDPQDKEISGENGKKPYKVLFQGNSVQSNDTSSMKLDRGNGGAIGNNGALEIGGTDDDVTKVELVKKWVNDQDVWNTYRPAQLAFLQNWLRLTRDAEPYPLGTITEKQCDTAPAETSGNTVTTCYYDVVENTGILTDIMIDLSYESDAEGYTDTWKVTIDGLEKSYYDDATSSVVDYVYDVMEDVKTTFSVNVDGTDQNFEVYAKVPAPQKDQNTGVFTFTDTFNLVSIEGEKTWDQQDVNIPSSVSVHLHDENNVKIGDPVTVTAQDGWKWKFEGLPKYRKDSENSYTEIKYWVHETAINNWDSESDRSQYVYGTDEEPLKYTGFNIKNTHNPNGDLSIEVIKAWDDKNDRDGKRANAEFTVYLWANGVPFYRDSSKVQVSEKLNAANNWHVKFTGLPEKNSDNEPITYTVTEEDPGNSGYVQTSIDTIYADDGTTIVGYTITNSYEPETVTLSVKKTWDDYSCYTCRPGGNLDLTDEGRVQDIIQFLEKIRLFRRGKGESESVAYHLTNIRYISGTEYQFTANDRLGQETYEITVMDNMDDTWTLSCSGLPRYEKGKELTWLIKEERIQNYTPQNVPEEGLYGTCSGEPGNVVCSYEVTNDLDVTTAILTKTWDDGGNVDTRPVPKAFLEGLRLYRSVTIGKETKKEFLEHGDFTVVQDPNIETTYHFTISAYSNITGTLVKNDEEGQWTVFVDYLPKRDANRNEYTWTIEESLPGYEPTIDNTYTDDITLKITNKPVVSIDVSKIWYDDITDPEPDMVDDGEDPSPVTGGHPEVTVTLQPSGQTLTLTAAGSWKGTFTNLPKYDESGNEIQYTVTEEVPDGYEGTKIFTAADRRVVFVNTKLIDIPVQKVWNHIFVDPETGEREQAPAADQPTEVTLHLHGGDNQPIETVTITADDNWSYTFEKLPMYDDSGNKITYSVSESPIKHYEEVTVVDETTGAVTITNNYTPNKRDLPVYKEWVGDEFYPEMRPASITVELYADGELLETQELNAENHWQHEFTDLEVYSDFPENQKEIKYTINEITVDGYVSEITGSVDEEYIIINSFIEPENVFISVFKEWSDDPNGEKSHPAVTVYLTADGKDVEGQTLTLSAENYWVGVFTDLPKYDEAGNEISYSVREDPVKGYKSSVTQGPNGIRITNSPEKTEPPRFPRFFPLEELPRTGFSALQPTALSVQPQKLNYGPSGLTLQIPSLDVSASIVTVPFADGQYPVEWLGDRAGMLEGSAKPGEGYTVLTGHNHLNTMEAGPFALLSGISEGDMIFVVNEAGELLSYKVYTNAKIASDNSAALEHIAKEYEGSLTLLTCEDETPEGSYANRRVIAARPMMRNAE